MTSQYEIIMSGVYIFSQLQTCIASVAPLKSFESAGDDAVTSWFHDIYMYDVAECLFSISSFICSTCLLK